MGGNEISQHVKICASSSSLNNEKTKEEEEEETNFLVQKPKREFIGLENSIRSNCLHSFFVCVYRDCCTRARPHANEEEEEEEKQHFFFLVAFILS